MHLHECESTTLSLVDCLSNIRTHIHIHKMYLLEMPYALWQFALGSPFTLTSMLTHTHTPILAHIYTLTHTRMSLRSGDSPLLMLLQAIWLLVVFVIPSKPKISERICCCRLLLPLLFVLFACALFSYSFAYNKIKDCVWDFVFADLKRKPSANKRSTALAMPYLLSPSPVHLQPSETAALLPWVAPEVLVQIIITYWFQLHNGVSATLN